MALLSAKSTGLPSKGKPLDIYYCTDTRETYLVAGDGVLLNVRDILQGTTGAVRAVGPQGQPGRSIKGDVGAPGRDGVPGKDGISITGPRGHAGKDGQSIIGPPGERGQAATITVGEVKTVPYGNQARVWNSGADHDAVLNFEIPIGQPGEVGVIGPRGPIGETSYIYVDGPAVETAHKEILAARAKVLATIEDKVKTMGSHPVYRLARMHLEDVKREVEKL